MVKMNKKITRPFDFLQEAKNKRVLIELEDGLRLSGILKSFDSSLNLVLEDVLIDNTVRLPFVFLRSVHGSISI